mmetsp:Transcript_14714/g.40940  ORF Transcript_14714/g.40940 Transcript_14714/m.40940 type:complete len:270 (-) Transcript_14714:26-835(-)
MRPRGRQSQKLLDEIVDHQLGGDDHAHVYQPGLRATKEFGQSAVAVDFANDRSEISGLAALGTTLGAGASAVRLGEDHVPGLAAQAGRNAGAKGAQQGDHPLELGLAQNRQLFRDGIQKLGHQIETDLLSEGVRDLLGQHGPDSRHHDPESVLPNDAGQSAQDRVGLVGRVRHLLDAEGFHRHQQDGGDRTGKDAAEDKGHDPAPFADERQKDRLGHLVGPEFHGPLDAVSQNGGTQSVQEGGGSSLLLVGTNLHRGAYEALALEFLKQ